MKLDWNDFNVGIVVNTNKGEGFILSIDKPNDKLGIKLSEGNYEYFKINEINLPLGSFNIHLTQHIGQYILLFQRIENRLRDFLNNVLVLNTVQKKELTTSFTAGKLIEKVDALIKKYAEKEESIKWNNLTSELKAFNKVRNTIVHGYLFHYSENHELDFKNIKIENANGNVELLDFEKLLDLNKKVTYLYYSVQKYFDTNAQEIIKKTTGNSTYTQ